MDDITFLPVENPKRTDHSQWKGFTTSERFEHTMVLWRGQHVLSIERYIDHNPQLKESKSDVEDNHVDPGPKITYIVYTQWPWLKHFYGECNSVEAAQELAAKELTDIFRNIRRAFAIRKL